nr:ulp1 protease family, C-terminal catalytic domain-containing protein [Tanacetum cinerariifolium]
MSLWKLHLLRERLAIQRKVSRLMKINRHMLKDEGVQGKAMMKRKSKQLVLKVRSIKLVLKVKKKNKSKISDDENNRNSKIRTRTTPMALFNTMAILNDDRKKCLHEMGFGSMIGMGIHELSRKLGFYVIDNFDTETNVLSLTDSSILVALESMNDILGIPMGGCSIESLEPRTHDDPFIKEWLSQFGEKTKIRPNDISDVIVSTKDAGKLFKMNFLMLFANTMELYETSGVCSMYILRQIRDDVCIKTIDWCNYIIRCLKESKGKWVNPATHHYTGPLTFMILNELNKKFQEDFCNKDLVRNEDAEDANVANPSEAANVAQASPTAQGSRAAILHASPIRMTKKAAKRTERVGYYVSNLDVQWSSI